ncbi:DUF4350 domain-containing protein [Aegicerativicinus sediminis]|uniref:DUF4350 domain-containing protein n=1 Tax=Aegicerativicinus sediminis TaxID=2893202 RepID=UPI001E4AAEFA|nr:DUF4350 domain-containing protein [Aegicerativicinus sediminis]
MDRRSKIWLYLIVFIILLMMVAEITKPKAINWRDSYSASDKIPLGCYIIHNELNSFYNKELITTNQALYDFIKEYKSDNKTTLLMINNEFHFDKEESKILEEFVSEGNSVFISGLYLYGALADTLNLSTMWSYNTLFKKQSHSLFNSPSLKDRSAYFEDVIENSYLNKIDTTNTLVLGNMRPKDSTKTYVNYVKIPFGNENGAFYVHTNPFAFTNYHMLRDKTEYAAAVLSFLPNDILIWDNYHKTGRKVITSPLRFILTNSALRWGFYVSLIGLILYVLFQGKRTQRIIPIVSPPRNASVEFTKTIGDLYFQHGDYSNIIGKKITYFLEYVRSTYYLNTDQFNERFIRNLSQKSGNTIEQTKQLVDYIIYLKNKNQHNQKELIELNKLIEQFKTATT